MNAPASRARLLRFPLLAPALAVLAACSSPSGGASSGAGSSSSSGSAPDAGACSFAGPPEAAITPAPIHTPRWVFEPWMSKDKSSGPDAYATLQGFHDRDIPVGTYVLDSPWETNYNTFIPSPSRYPDFAKMVTDFHAQGVRLVVWIDPFVNTTSYDLENGGGDTYDGAAPNYQQASDCGFFVDQGTEYSWWKGPGGALDFFNPLAVTWWHRQQDQVLDLGIDGWKTDFGDSYVSSDPVQTAAGPVSHQAYSEAYYRDFYSYGIQHRGKDFTMMTRAWDESYSFAGRFYARKENAPIAWMGDNRRDWVGIADVLDEMFRSAAAGYVVLGSDLGGYLDRDDKNVLGPTIPFDPVVFARWTALGALSPFMQLHSRTDISPWTVPVMADTIVPLYRFWSKLHHELVPFFYSLAEEAYAGGSNLIRPVGAQAQWTGDYRFQLGDALLVAPLLDGTGKRDVALPAGASWYDWWAPTAGPLTGGTTIKGYDSTDLARSPLFIRAGAIVPLTVEDDATGLGTAASAGKLTVLVYPSASAPSSFRLHEEDDQVTTLTAAGAGTGFNVTLSRVLRATLLRVRADVTPTSVKVNGAAVPQQATRAAFDAAATGWFVESATRSVWVKMAAGSGATTVVGG